MAKVAGRRVSGVKVEVVPGEVVVVVEGMVTMDNGSGKVILR